MEMTSIIGFLGAFLTTISFLPQAIKTIKTNETKGISLGMYIIFVSGVCFWLIYGILLHNWIMITANIVTFIFSGAVLVMKIKNLKSEKE